LLTLWGLVEDLGGEYVAIVAWIIASWFLSSLIASPVIGGFMKHGLGEDRSAKSASFAVLTVPTK